MNSSPAAGRRPSGNDAVPGSAAEAHAAVPPRHVLRISPGPTLTGASRVEGKRHALVARRGRELAPDRRPERRVVRRSCADRRSGPPMQSVRVMSSMRGILHTIAEFRAAGWADSSEPARRRRRRLPARSPGSGPLVKKGRFASMTRATVIITANPKAGRCPRLFADYRMSAKRATRRVERFCCGGRGRRLGSPAPPGDVKGASMPATRGATSCTGTRADTCPATPSARPPCRGNGSVRRGGA